MFYLRASEGGGISLSNIIATVNVLYNMERSMEPNCDEYRQISSKTVEIIDPFQHYVRYMSMKVRCCTALSNMTPV